MSYEEVLNVNSLKTNKYIKCHNYHISRHSHYRDRHEKKNTTPSGEYATCSDYCGYTPYVNVQYDTQLDTEGTADFEITGDTVNGKHHRGPTRSRLSNTNLLTSYQIYFTGETSELPLEVLENLVKTLGGKLVTNPNCFDLKSKKTCLIISSGNQESHKLAKNVHKKKGVLLLSREWLLDSVAMYEIQSLDGYILL
eukprot:XP_014790196.1 PREDICTED: breast cancer type 1 susceptibility protein homolog [Octopus bimaculoides]